MRTAGHDAAAALNADAFTICFVAGDTFQPCWIQPAHAVVSEVA